MSKADVGHNDRSDSIKLILHSQPSFFIRYGNILIFSAIVLLIGCVTYLPYNEEIPVSVVFSTTKVSSKLAGNFQIPYAPASTLQRGKKILLASHNNYLYCTITDIKDTTTINYTKKVIYIKVDNIGRNINSRNLNMELALQYMINIRYSRFINKLASPK